MPVSCCNDAENTPLYVGGGRRLRFIVKDNDGTRTNPSTVVVVMTDPSGNETTYTWAANEVVQDGTGNFHFDNDWDEAGTWEWSVLTTGSVHDKKKGTVEVLP